MKTEPNARVGKAMRSGGGDCSKQSMPLLKRAAATQFQLTSVMLGCGPSVSRFSDFSRKAMN